MLRRPTLLFATCSILALSLSIIAVYGAAALGTKEAREKIALLAGLANLPKESVHIKSITPGPGENAIVEAQIDTAFKFNRINNNWQVTEIRLGDRQWESLELITTALNKEKSLRTQAEMTALSVAVNAYRREHGRLVPAQNIVELTDALSPTYLALPIRLDAWGRELIYRLVADGYQLRSAGPDGKVDTPDDIVSDYKSNA